MLKNLTFWRTVILAVGTAIASAGLTIGWRSHYPTLAVSWWLFWICAVIFCIYRRDKMEEAAKNEARILEEAAKDEARIEYLLKTFYTAMEFPPEADVRCCLVLEDDDDNVIHVTDFLPRQLGTHGKGIYYHKSKGIVGEALAKGNSVAYGMPGGYDPNSWLQSLKAQWHFTQEEFASIPLDRRGFLAQLIPEQEKRAVLGIIYCDTKDPVLFNAEEDPSLLHKAELLADFFRPSL